MKFVDCGEAARHHLIQADPVLGAHIERLGELKRPCHENLFSALISSIVSQLISKKAATTVYGRLAELAGGEVSAQSIFALEPQSIKECGMSMRKAQTIHSIAEKAVSGEVDFDHLETLSDDEVIKLLSALPGVGEWTAQMLMIFAMGRPDVVSYKDLGIRRGMTNVYGLQSLSKNEFDSYRKAYSPYGSTASIYLWHLSDELTGTVDVNQLPE